MLQSINTDAKRVKGAHVQWLDHVVEHPLFDGNHFQNLEIAPDVCQHVPYPTLAWNSVERSTEDAVELGCGLFEQDAAAGPFGFVVAGWFAVLSTIVIVINVTELYVELIGSPGYVGILINQWCLCFYVLEVTCRILHYQKSFFQDENRMWNILDLVVVVAGVVEWLLAFVHQSRKERDSGNSYIIITAIRSLRLVRFLRLFRLFLTSDLKWTESAGFECVTSGFIVASMIVLGLETDIESSYWDFVEHCILVYFVFEICVRLRRQGLGFFFTAEDWCWNWLDFFIVMFGVCDVWLLDWIVTLVTGDLHATGAELGQVVVAVRMLRLLRVLRLVRVVKAIRPLYLLAMGVIESMQSMFWVLMLTFVALYISSILVTRVVGHGDFLAFDDETVQARLLFRDVHTSFFTLFAIINSQDWYEVEPLLRVNPIVKLVFVCFIVFCSWALLSIMTGVVADNMILAREYQKEQDKAAHQAHMQDVEQAIKTLLVAADSAGCGRMTKENYGQVLEIPHYARMFRDLAPNSDSKDIRDLFTWLESNDDGVQFDELLEGLRCLCEPVTGQTVLKLDSVVRHKFQGFDKICMLLREDVAHIRRRSQIYQAAILRQMKSGSAEAAPPGLRSQNTITSFSDMVDEIPVQVDN